MTILAGIDEAGYGPLLGPLVVSSAAIELPDEKLSSDLWQVLSKAISMEKRSLHGRLLVTDSKKAHTKKGGYSALKRTVLAFLHAQNPELSAKIQNLEDFLKILCPDCWMRLGSYPWYSNLANVSFKISDEIRVAGSMLKKCLEAENMRIIGLESRCLDVGYYNQRIESVQNKSRVLFTDLCSLVLSTLERYPSKNDGKPVQFMVDRQGGRTNYRYELQRMFPDCALTVLRQDQKLSSYEVQFSRYCFRIHFVISADSKYMPVSLASMVSKLVRELLVECLNHYFIGICSDIKPTAGYWQDGKRFIQELSEKYPNLEISQKKLVRVK